MYMEMLNDDEKAIDEGGFVGDDECSSFDDLKVFMRMTI